jgi:TonB family protein
MADEPGPDVDDRRVARGGVATILLARRRDGFFGLAFGFVVAVLLHVLLVPAVDVFGQVRERDPAGRRRTGQLLLLARAPEASRRVELEIKSPPELPEKEKEKAPEDDDKAPGQVVSLPPPEKEERPDAADYASEWDQRAAHETRSRDQRQHAQAVTRELQEGRLAKVMPAPSSKTPADPVPTPPAPPREASGPAGPGRVTAGDSGTDETDGSGERMFSLEIPRQAAREPLRLRMDAEGLFKNREAVPEIRGNGENARVALGNTPADHARRQGSGGSGADTGQGLLGGGNNTLGLPSLDQLTPSPSELARMSGAPANDFLPEVEVDAETRLNAWRWKHATFFNRIADAIRREWQGGHVLSSNDPAGRVYGFEDRMTVLQVTLDRSGKVVDVNVASASGAIVLDDEAVRAFKEAGPFTNPPAQLFKGRDNFTFLFGFNVSYNRTNIDLNWRPY